MRQPMRVSRPLSSRTGRFQVYTQIAQTAARPRKRDRSPFTAAWEDGVIAGAFAVLFLIYFGVQVVRGLVF